MTFNQVVRGSSPRWLTEISDNLSEIFSFADMAELADALDLGSSGNTRAGSTPVIRIIFLYSRNPPVQNP